MTRSAADIAYWLEVAEGRAWTDMYRAMDDGTMDDGAMDDGAMDDGSVERLGAQVGTTGDVVTFTLRTLDSGFFNRSIGLGVGRAATAASVARVLEAYRAAGQTNFTIQISPFARPTSLETWLEDAGMRRGRRWAKLWRDTSGPLAERTALRIEEVGPERRDDWNRVTLAAFEMPDMLAPYMGATLGRENWHHYLAFDGDLAVGAGGLYVMGKVGWLGFGATLESHRGRGSQGAIFSRRVRDAAKLGVKLLITETGEDLPDAPNPSYRNMIRSGFRLAYQRLNWLQPAAPDKSAT